MAYVTTPDGTNIYVEEYGQGPAIFFLHGFALSCRVWDSQLLDLSDHYHILTCDLRGHGRSDRPRADCTMETMAGDIQAILETRDLRDVTLVGWSMGACVATAHARLYQDGRVGRLVLVDGGPRLLADSDFPGLPEPAFDGMVEAMSQDWPAFTHQWVARFFARDPGEPIRNWLAALMLDTPSWIAVTTMRGAKRVDERDTLRRLQLPTLVVHGEQDAIVPLPLGLAYQALIPQVRMVIIPGCGHVPFLERRPLFNDILTRFVEGMDPAEVIEGQKEQIGSGG